MLRSMAPGAHPRTTLKSLDSSTVLSLGGSAKTSPGNSQGSTRRDEQSAASNSSTLGPPRLQTCSAGGSTRAPPAPPPSDAPPWFAPPAPLAALPAAPKLAPPNADKPEAPASSRGSSTVANSDSPPHAASPSAIPSETATRPRSTARLCFTNPPLASAYYSSPLPPLPSLPAPHRPAHVGNRMPRVQQSMSIGFYVATTTPTPASSRSEKAGY